MSGKVNPEVTVVLDKKRTMRFDLNAMVALEDATGKNIGEIYDGTGVSAKHLRALLWACLMHEDPELTQEQVGSMISLANMGDISTKVAEALSLAMPEATKKQLLKVAAGEGESPLARTG